MRFPLNSNNRVKVAQSIHSPNTAKLFDRHHCLNKTGHVNKRRMAYAIGQSETKVWRRIPLRKTRWAFEDNVETTNVLTEIPYVEKIIDNKTGGFCFASAVGHEFGRIVVVSRGLKMLCGFFVMNTMSVRRQNEIGRYRIRTTVPSGTR